MALSAHYHPYDERTGENSGNERDDYRRHGTFLCCTGPPPHAARPSNYVNDAY
jgi:hypothetical protein